MDDTKKGETFQIVSPCPLRSTRKGCTLCLLTFAGAASLYADFSGMTVTVFIVHTFHRFAVDLTLRRRFTGYIAVGIGSTFLEAVTASLTGTLCTTSSHYNLI